MENMHTLSIHFHRARPRAGKPCTLAAVRITRPGLVRQLRILLPVSLEQAEGCRLAVAGMLRHMRG